MNVLILGSGGREYSIGLAISKDEAVESLYFSPGNGATDMLGTNFTYENYDELLEQVKEYQIDFTIVGPEAPLVDGVVDLFKAQGLTIFGPSRAAAQLEGSKAYMKSILKKYNIPTASFLETGSLDDATTFIHKQNMPIVVKADGLCAGKGVIIAQSAEEAISAAKQMLDGSSFGDAGKRVIIEEYLDGYELSLFAICDGENYKLLPAAQDHKRLLDGDMGPNTGGMGAYAPTPLVNESIYRQVKKNIIEPTLKGMQQEGAPYEGVLFIGAMVVNEMVYTLEYNVRFGDPECEVLMPLLKSSALDLFYKAATHNLETLDISFNDEVAVGVVLASKEYPYQSSQPAEIVIDENHHEELAYAHISYAGVTREDGVLFATGGRVMVCIGKGKDVQEARYNAYLQCGQVHFAGKKLRTDIAYQAL